MRLFRSTFVRTVKLVGVTSIWLVMPVRVCPWYCTNWCSPGVPARLCNRGECDPDDPLACREAPVACKETCSEYTPPVGDDGSAANDISIELIILPATALCCTACCLLAFFNRHCWLESFRRGVDSEYVRNYYLSPKEKDAVVARANAQFEANMRADGKWRDSDHDHSWQVDELGDVENGHHEILHARMHRANTAHIHALPPHHHSPRRGSKSPRISDRFPQEARKSPRVSNSSSAKRGSKSPRISNSSSARRGSRQHEEDAIGAIAAQAVELHSWTLDNALKSFNSPRVSNCPSSRRSSISSSRQSKQNEADEIAAIVGRAVELHSWTLEDPESLSSSKRNPNSIGNNSKHSADDVVVPRAVDLHSVRVDAHGRIVNAIFEDGHGKRHVQSQKHGNQQFLEALGSPRQGVEEKNRPASNSPPNNPSQERGVQNVASDNETAHDHVIVPKQQHAQAELPQRRGEQCLGALGPRSRVEEQRKNVSNPSSSSPRPRRSNRDEKIDKPHENPNAPPVEKVADIFGVMRRRSSSPDGSPRIGKRLSGSSDPPDSNATKQYSIDSESRNSASIEQEGNGYGLPEPRSASGSPRRRSAGRMAAAIDARVMLDNFGNSPRSSTKSPRTSGKDHGSSGKSPRAPGKSPRTSGKSLRNSRQEPTQQVPEQPTGDQNETRVVSEQRSGDSWL